MNHHILYLQVLRYRVSEDHLQQFVRLSISLAISLPAIQGTTSEKPVKEGEFLCAAANASVT